MKSFGLVHPESAHWHCQGSFSEAILLPSGRRTVRGWGDPSRLPCTSAIRDTFESSSSHSSPRWSPENWPASWKGPADPRNSAACNLRGDPPVLSALPQSFSAVLSCLPRSGRQCIFFPVLLSLRWCFPPEPAPHPAFPVSKADIRWPFSRPAWLPLLLQAGSKSLPPAPAFLSCGHLLFQICGSSPLRYAFCLSDFSPRTVPDGNSCSRRSARSGIPFGISHRAALSLSCHSAPSVPGARNSAGAPLHTSDREVSQPCISILSSAQSVQYEWPYLPCFQSAFHRAK